MPTRFEQLRDLTHRIEKDPTLAQEFEKDPKKIVSAALSGSPVYTGDKWIYRMVVLFLGLVMLTAAAGAIIAMLQSTETEVPAALVAFGSGAIGAVAGLLAPSPVSGTK
jgi:hypothetical protein